MNKDTTYTPRPGSVPAKVVKYLRAHPAEQLSIDDVSDRFDTVRGSVHTLLALAVDAKLLKRTRDEDGAYVYQIAPSVGIDIDQVHMGATKPARPDKTKTSGYAAPRHDVLDFDTLVVDEGIPFAPRALKKGDDKWAPLFSKLTKPGQSLVIPITVRTAVGAAATKRNRLKTMGTYRVAMVSDKAARVWRLA